MGDESVFSFMVAVSKKHTRGPVISNAYPDERDLAGVGPETMKNVARRAVIQEPRL